jgi:Txe/YoeB family toxin of toxin-antitoxin system
MEIVFTKQAIKDFEKIKSIASLYRRVISLLNLLETNPYTRPPTYEKLIGMENVYSRRINIHHRLVYQIYEKENVVKIIRLWTHYE